MQLFAFSHQDFDFTDAYLGIIQTSDSPLSPAGVESQEVGGLQRVSMHTMYLIVELENNNIGATQGQPPWLARRPGAADHISSDLCSLQPRVEVKLFVSDATQSRIRMRHEKIISIP